MQSWVAVCDQPQDQGLTQQSAQSAALWAWGQRIMPSKTSNLG